MKTEQVRFLLENDLTFEEFNFLEVLLQMERTPDDITFREVSREYYKAKKDSEKEMLLREMVDKLEGLDFLESFLKYFERFDAFGDFYTINFGAIRVTDTYKELFFTDKKEESFREFIEIFGKSYYIGENRISTLNPEKGESFSDIEDRYWKLVESGNLKKIKAVHSNTANYVKYIGNNMNINKFLNGYQGYMLTLQEKLNEINNG